jgi:predicted  nucleic acid-binding Zn-ribbon protein
MTNTPAKPDAAPALSDEPQERYVRRVCRACSACGEFERIDATRIQCASCSAIRLDDEDALPRKAPSTEQAHKRLLGRPTHEPAAVEHGPSNGKPTPQPMAAVDVREMLDAPLATERTELQALRRLRDMLIRDLHMADVRSVGEIVMRVAQLAANLEHAEQRVEAAERLLDGARTDAVQWCREADQLRERVETAERECASREHAQERLIAERAKAERRLAELTALASRAAQLKGDSLLRDGWVALGELREWLDRQAREAGAQTGADYYDEDARIAELTRRLADRDAEIARLRGELEHAAKHAELLARELRVTHADVQRAQATPSTRLREAAQFVRGYTDEHFATLRDRGYGCLAVELRMLREALAAEPQGEAK